MRLDLGDGGSIENPSPFQISDFLSRLDGTGDSFAILERDEMSYVQTSGDPSGGFLVEYQVDSIDQHFRSTRYDLPFSTVEAIFKSYAAGNEEWKTMADWERDELVGASGSSLPWALMAVVAIAGFAALAWYRAA